MHVLHVYKDYAPVLGGIENHLSLLAEGQARRGLEVTVLVTAPQGRTTISREKGVRVIRAARVAKLASTPLSPALMRHFWRQRPDVVHLQFPYPWGEVAQLLGRGNGALVVSYQSDIVRQRWLGALYKPLARRLLMRANRILTSTEAYLRTSKVLRPFVGKSTVVPLGIDVQRFADPEADAVAALRRKYSGPLLLFVGRLRYYKGLEVLIDAMPEVGGTLLVVGRGPMETALRQRAAACDASERIIFVGDVADDDLPAFHAAADVFVLPSNQRSEAFGLAQVEALAAGTPVISTELGTGTSTVNVEGQTGFVVPPNDSRELAAAVNRLLGDDALRTQLGEGAAARARAEFDAEVMVDRVVEIYSEVLAGTTV